MTEIPSLFVSHGAPTILDEKDSPARAFLSGLGKKLDAAVGRPKAVLCITAHWETAAPVVGTATAPETIHDFHGFADSLYQLTYPAPGAPDVAVRAAHLLGLAGLPCGTDDQRGLDHGTWVPLMLMYPDAHMPTAQLSVQTERGPAAHLELGLALAPLRHEGVLVLGSGGAVHNLADYCRSQNKDQNNPAPWAVGFEDWLVDGIGRGAAADVADYRRLSADGIQAHPRDEHFLPLLAAMGAGGAGKSRSGDSGPGKSMPGRVLHRGFEHGSIGMAAFAFGGQL